MGAVVLASAPISHELATFMQCGLSLAVGTRDAALAPEGTRAWAAVVDPDHTHVTVFIHAPSAGPTLANLEANGLMTVLFEYPPTHRACQAKGTFVAVRPARDDERAEIERQVAGFAAGLQAIGIPAQLLVGAQTWPALAVTMRVTDLFRQDPGPGAGERMPPGGRVIGEPRP